MKLGIAGIVLAAAVLAIGCPPPPPPPDAPGPDADAAPLSSDCLGFCAALELAGCDQGHPKPPTTCRGKCQQILDTHLTPLPIECVIGSTTRAQVRACGVGCTPE
jgi:hypothetical protein